MKIQILHLEPFDSLVSIKDKLQSRQAEYLLLVLPVQRHCGVKKELSNYLNMRLLQRYAEQLGVNISLITRDHTIQKIALSAGISWFSEAKSARRVHWGLRAKKRKKNRIDQIRQQLIIQRWRLENTDELPALLNTIRIKKLLPARSVKPTQKRTSVNKVYSWGVISLVALFLMLIFLPTAEITLVPKRETQEQSLWITAGEFDSIDAIHGYIPLNIQESVYEGEKEIRTSGVTFIPSNVIRGKVKLKNISPNEVIVPKETVITPLDEDLAQKVKFITEEEVILQPQTSEEDKDKEVFVYAAYQDMVKDFSISPDDPLGLEMAIGLDVIPYQLNIFTRNIKNQMPIATEEDRQKIYDLLIRDLINKARKDSEFTFIDQNTKTEDLFLSKEPIEMKILQKEYSPQPDQPSEVVSLKLKVLFRWESVSGKQLIQLGKGVLDRSFGMMYEEDAKVDLVRAVLLSNPEHIDKNPLRYQIKVKFQRSFFKEFDSGKIYKLIRGLTREQAIEKLEKELELEGKPTIINQPKWFGYLPLLPFRYTITFQ